MREELPAARSSAATFIGHHRRGEDMDGAGARGKRMGVTGGERGLNFSNDRKCDGFGSVGAQVEPDRTAGF